LAVHFASSALRHGIGAERALYVVDNCPSPSYEEDSSGEGNKILFLWADREGVPLEVGAVELESGDLLVIHAMKMRKLYQADYKRLLAWSRS
jgi:hypothetical protein